MTEVTSLLLLSSSSDGNSSLCDEGSSALYVQQTATQLESHWDVVWLDALSEQLVEGARLQQMFCCLAASTSRVLLHIANVDFGV